MGDSMPMTERLTSSCPKLISTPRRRARRGWNTHSSWNPWMRPEAMLKRDTKAQDLANKVAAIHRLLPAVVQWTVQLHRTIRNGIAPRVRWGLPCLPPRRGWGSFRTWVPRLRPWATVFGPPGLRWPGTRFGAPLEPRREDPHHAALRPGYPGLRWNHAVG